MYHYVPDYMKGGQGMDTEQKIRQLIEERDALRKRIEELTKENERLKMGLEE
ncbi:MAG: hypothetical protein LBD04_06190 [Synergistaceae bacterium]|jgi:regulator of replication initiation timing|nr:hypothetical protein [Synergistaceae bacterium]